MKGMYADRIIILLLLIIMLYVICFIVGLMFLVVLLKDRCRTFVFTSLF